jgi:uncharacterized protein (DUF302 family)
VNTVVTSMAYYFSKLLSVTFDEAIKQTTAALKREGFGIITEIDVQETLKKKSTSTFGLTESWERATRRLLMKR